MKKILSLMIYYCESPLSIIFISWLLGVLTYFLFQSTTPDFSREWLTGSSRWQSNNKLTDIPNIGLCYQVSTDEFIPVKYQQASGYQG